MGGALRPVAAGAAAAVAAPRPAGAWTGGGDQHGALQQVGCARMKEEAVRLLIHCPAEICHGPSIWPLPVDASPHAGTSS